MLSSFQAFKRTSLPRTFLTTIVLSSSLRAPIIILVLLNVCRLYTSN